METTADDGRRFALLSVTFLDPVFHGRADGDEPEWPPSPLRLFQALLAGASAASRAAGSIAETDLAAFRWLEQQDPPLVIAPVGRRGQAYRLSVPNNAMDVVAAAWARGNDSGRGDASPATHRSMKMVTPIYLKLSDTVHYAWPITESDSAVMESLQRVAMSLVALGWGVDLAFGAARFATEDEVRTLQGERWVPVTRPAGVATRVPVAGTLDALNDRHKRFLERLAGDGRFTPTPALTRFRRCHYARSSDRPSRPFAAFQFLSIGESGFRSFRAAQAAKVAGMVRHSVGVAASAAGRSADGLSPEDWADLYVHGHQREGAPSIGRFSYMPLPTIDPRGVVARIRRVIVVESQEGTGEHARWAGQSLVGEQLVNEQTKDAEATLARCPDTDYVLAKYVKTSRRWSTVTPVVLPWGDSGKPHRAEKQLLKAVRHAGYDVEDITSLELRREPFWRGCDVASAYFVPKHLRGTASWHVMLEWKHPVAGPVAIGSGRHCGLGLFASIEG
jgi:CRISPR-associated protein Csb2